jgi:type I restriction enzyme S subunit
MIESNFTQDISALKKLPNSWSVIDFGEVFTDISGGNKKFLKSDFLVEGKVAVVDQGKDLIAGYTNEDDEVVKGQPPYIVFGDHTRIFKFIDFPFVMGADGTKVFKVKDITINDEKYLFHFLNSLNIPNTGYNRHFKYLKSTKIPFPPLPQQQKIANILDAADALRQNDKALIAKYDELTQALFLDMFGDYLNGKLFPLKDLVKFSQGQQFGVEQQLLEPKEGYARFLRIVDYTQGEDLRFVPNNSKNYFVSKEDIVIVRYGASAGFVGTNKEGVLANNLFKVNYDKHMYNQAFLYFIFQNDRFKKFVNKEAFGAAMPALSFKVMERFEIPVPPIELQNQFAERVAVIEEQKAIAKKSLEKSEELFNSLLQKAFKGELV